MYKEMRDGFAGTHFYVCITPVSRHLLSLLMEEGRWTDYARWLKELVEVYGEVWNFMYLNEVTENVPEYFMDAHHTSPEVLSVMAKKLYGLPVAPRFKHFGLRMTQETLVDDLVYLHEHMPKIDTKPSP
ncbi:MAG: hypothetical protein CSA21_03845 [Deltaproteobacteria bacterium]|nr:MAG: hypothetical protein CSA21_03845 [Deltaproteobacteria bacterium]